MTEARMTTTTLYTALRSCKPQELQCRWDGVIGFGLHGLRESFEFREFSYKPGPSLTTIERAMKIVTFAFGKILGTRFKIANGVFKIIYRPHFKLLKMFDKTFERYWEHLEFVRWSLETLQELTIGVNGYIKATGQFNLQDTLLYFSKLDSSKDEVAMRDLKTSAKILADFDELLLEDLQEFENALIDGMEQAVLSQSAKTIPDQIALLSLVQDLQLLYLQLDQEYPALHKNLVAHFESWHSVSSGLRPRQFDSKRSHILLTAILKAINILFEKADGK